MNKHDVVYSPSDFVAYMKQNGMTSPAPAPHSVILCYSDELLSHVKQTCHTIPWGHFDPAVCFLINGNVGLAGGFGIGSPAAVAILEELIASGVQEFISIGTAGSLQKHVGIGDIIVCEKAIRGEGTSQHYLPLAKYSEAHIGITKRIKNALRENDEKAVHAGSVWTTDAPYREIKKQVRAYQAEGVLAVEMEAAALFAAAKCRGVELGVVLTIGDSLADLTWEPHFLSKPVQDKVQTIYEIALKVLTV